jgi:thiol:disulfide interchange protein
MKPVWGLFIILVAVVGISMLVRAFAAAEVVPWREDFAAAQAEARDAGKPVFAYFTASWCGPCQQMQRTTWADASVEAALADYVPVKIDIDRHQALAMQYGVQGIPYMVVLDEAGQPVRETVGYHSSTDFINWLRRF